MFRLFFIVLLPELEARSELILAKKRHRVRDNPFAWQYTTIVALKTWCEPLSVS